MVPTANRFLRQLPPATRQRLQAACTTTELKLGQVLTRPGERLKDVYFPCGAYISQVMSLEGHEVEVGLVGDEGMYGLQSGMGLGVSTVTALVQGGGPALRMPLAAFNARLSRSRELRDLTSRYTYFVFAQAIQSAGCNRFHLMEERLSRWLLLIADRAHSNTFETTHKALAAMLGVRRAGVTATAKQLQARELIKYSRGRVTVVDRGGLETLACSCYRADTERYRRFVSPDAGATRVRRVSQT